MFQKTRIKLTSWYLLIIMLISISFSIAIYQVLDNELNRVERVERLRQNSRLYPSFPRNFFRTSYLDPEVIEESKSRIGAILILINLGILAASSVAGYFLAGRTLKPIQSMIDEQNRFITDASHELRTPITSLKAELEVNLRDRQIGSSTKKILQSNLEDVNQLQILSDDLIKLAQYGKNNGLVFEKISVSTILADALKKVNGLAKLKKITIKNQIQEQILEGDKQSLSEVFVILLDNAIKYSPKNTTVSISTKKVNDSLEIDIKDEGIGIDQQDLPYLFDRFYRADKSRTKSGTQGFGLGLSIAKKIIDKHQGQIKVVSYSKKTQDLDHQGTTFSVHLPLKHF